MAHAFDPDYLAAARERARKSRAAQGLPMRLAPEIAAKVARLVAGATRSDGGVAGSVHTATPPRDLRNAS